MDTGKAARMQVSHILGPGCQIQFEVVSHGPSKQWWKLTPPPWENPNLPPRDPEQPCLGPGGYRAGRKSLLSKQEETVWPEQGSEGLRACSQGAWCSGATSAAASHHLKGHSDNRSVLGLLSAWQSPHFYKVATVLITVGLELYPWG